MPRLRAINRVMHSQNDMHTSFRFLIIRDNATGSPPVYVRAPGLRDLGQGVRKVRELFRNVMSLRGCDPSSSVTSNLSKYESMPSGRAAVAVQPRRHGAPQCTLLQRRAGHLVIGQ